MNAHIVIIDYSRDLLLAATRAFWFRLVVRRLGWKFLLALVLTAVATLQLFSADRLTGGALFALGAFSLVLALVPFSYFLRRHHVLSTFAKMKSPRTIFTFRDGDFSLSTDLGSTTLFWSTVTDLWEFPAFWLLFVAKGTYLTLPLDALDAPTRQFIKSKAGLAMDASTGGAAKEPNR